MPTFLIAIGLDLAVVAILIYSAQIASKKGFVRTVIQMIAYVVVLVASAFFSRAAAPVLYERVVVPMLEERADEFGRPPNYEAHNNAALVSADDGSISAAMDGILEELDPQGIIGDLSDATLRPLLISGISMIVFVVLFAVLSMVVNTILSMLGIINHIPVIGRVNATLGGVVGLLQGLMIVLILAVLMQGIFYLYPQGWEYLNPQIISQSYIFKHFFDLEKIANVLL